MLYAEYDWTFNVYRIRFGSNFIEWNGQRSFESKDQLKADLAYAGLKLGKKTDSRSWAIIKKN